MIDALIHISLHNDNMDTNALLCAYEGSISEEPYEEAYEIALTSADDLTCHANILADELALMRERERIL
jgi:hypothetical protein